MTKDQFPQMHLLTQHSNLSQALSSDKCLYCHE